MTKEEYFTIGELAGRSGLTARTIRYYTSEGLLPPPETRGKYARYSLAHLERLREIGKLKAQYLPLSVIRAQLGVEGAKPPADLAAPPQVRPIVPPGYSPTPDTRLRPSAEAELNAADPFRLSSTPLQTGRVEFFPSNTEPVDETDELSEDLRQALERWERVVLAPGIELHVRGSLAKRKQQQLSRMIAIARDILAGEE